MVAAEDMVFVDKNGKMDNCGMDKSHRGLLMFCINVNQLKLQKTGNWFFCLTLIFNILNIKKRIICVSNL